MLNPFKVNGKKNILALIISIVLAEGIGFLSSYIGMTDTKSYESLIKPAFAPPGWVFAVVWPILYLLMGIAAYRIWMKGREGADTRKALILYSIQLFLNFMWTIIFFRWRLIGLAFFELMLLLIFILLTTFEFFKFDKLAGIIMIPYILWVSFAGVLNFTLWMLNNM
ncbi:tryptophan-rich sensory protein [Clostridium swellfunianum]|uniref:TspO/MBR family protein n=1 Tax=Clostridium swellfunianum TaxID=1367462 RepID=UPI00202FE3D8|nr:tryptophan-rich sensory protein [Clostridium swellfunianum]